MNATYFEYPTTVKEAVERLGAPDAIAVSGGITVSTDRRRAGKALVDLTHCGLDRIESTAETLRLGATVRMADIDSAALPDDAGSTLLIEAAQGIATLPVRNAITVGGNLVQLVSWADLPVALLALDATVNICDAERGEYEAPIAQAVAEHPKRLLSKGAIVTGVTIARRSGPWGAAYQRFRTTETDYALMSVAAVVGLDADRCTHAAIAVGAIGPRPVRASEAEAMLVGTSLDSSHIAAAAARLAEQVSVKPSIHIDREMRRRILRPIAERTLTLAAERARKCL